MSNIVTQLTVRSASTAFSGLKDAKVDSELTRKLLLGVFEKKVPKFSSIRQSYSHESDSENVENDDDSRRKKLHASKGNARVESYHSAGNDNGEEEEDSEGKWGDEDSEEPKSLADSS